jgi:hypothetical protein
MVEWREVAERLNDSAEHLLATIEQCFPSGRLLPINRAFKTGSAQGDRARSARASVNTLHLKLGSFQGSAVRCAR